MSAFPLQKELVDSVINFANLDLQSPQDVSKCFDGTWTPTEIPKLRECRRLRHEVRRWLLEAKLGSADHLLALYGVNLSRQTGGKPEKLKVSKDIRLEGGIYVDVAPQGRGVENPIRWRWQVAHASLRAICGLAVTTICEQGLHHKVHECKREGCSNIFVDRQSRGTQREYCLTPYCNNQRNKEAVQKSIKHKGKKKRKTVKRKSP